MHGRGRFAPALIPRVTLQMSVGSETVERYREVGEVSATIFRGHAVEQTALPMCVLRLRKRHTCSRPGFDTITPWRH